MFDSVKSIVPVSVKSQIVAVRRRREIAREFRLDRAAYSTSSARGDVESQYALTESQLEVQLTKDYHRVEKGLTLEQPKRPFGTAVEKRLARLIPLADPEADYTKHAIDAYNALRLWNSEGVVDDTVSPVFDAVAPVFDEKELDAFFETRHSTRHFDASREVSHEVLEHAISLASHTPSVCNRQAARVHFYLGDKTARVLSHQNGNTGFRDSVRAVAVITVDRRLFAGGGERNQGWIDGGLMAMSLVWALHGLGLGTCMLNWSRGHRDSDALRREAGISEHEDIITMVAIGYPAENARVARSPKRQASQVASFVE